MRRKILLLFILTVEVFWSCFAEAQQALKIATIGWLVGRPASADILRINDMTQRVLRDLGYVEGKNIKFEYRYADNQLDRLPALAQELIRLKVDVIYAASANAAAAAKNATGTIPIVFVSTNDPIEFGLVDSLARPGSNLTGFTTISPILAGKRLELLKETVPSLTRIALLLNPNNPTSRQQWKESEASARQLGLQLHPMEVSSSDQLDNVFNDAIKLGNSAIAVTFDGLINSNQKRIANLAIKTRLPTICPRADFVESGGLISYGPDQTEPYRRVASMIGKIIKGSKPADIPVEQPTKFELVINLKTAKQIGLTVPPNVLYRADKVIK